MPGPSIYSEYPALSNKVGFISVIVLTLLALFNYVYSLNDNKNKFIYTVGYTTKINDSSSTLFFRFHGKEYIDTLEENFSTKKVFIRFLKDDSLNFYIVHDTIPVDELQGFGNEYEELTPTQYVIPIKQ
jgi:hypothetical protein